MFRSHLASSAGGAVHIVHYSQNKGFDCIANRLNITLCKFEHIGNGAAMKITKHMIIANDASPTLGVSLEHCTVLNNSIPGDTSSSVASARFYCDLHHNGKLYCR